MIFRTWRVLGVKVIVRTTPSPQCLQPNLTLLQVCVQEKSFPWKIDQNIRLFEKRKTDLKREDCSFIHLKITNTAKESIARGTVSLNIYLAIFQLTI